MREIVLQTSKEDRRTPIQVMAAMLGRLGGLKGGPARAAALSPERRREIAAMGGRASWARTPGRWDPREDEELQKRADELGVTV
jgi:general stress protein YciG